MGLRGYRSLTLEEVEVIRSSDHIFLDSYTSVIPDGLIRELADRLRVDVKPVDRAFLETGDELYDLAENSNVTLLVSGDPFMATTHSEIRFQCIHRGIAVRTYENASILNTLAGKCGISPYRTGAPVSVPRVSDKFFPLSVYDKIEQNMRYGKHTPLLLDTGGGRPMTPEEAITILESMESIRGKKIICGSTRMIIGTGIGGVGETIIKGNLRDLKKRSLKVAPSTIVILSDLTENEERYTDLFCSPLDE